MLKKLSRYALALIGLTILFSSCKKEYESIQSIDSKKVQDYLAKNNLTDSVQEDSDKTGFYYQVKNPGTGEFFANTDSVLYNITVNGLENGANYLTSPVYANFGTYVGYTPQLFPTTTIAGITVPAIRKVITYLKPGGSAKIFLPSYLAYGKNGSGEVPSNENILLNITTFPEKVQWKLDDRLITEFIAKNGLTMQKDPSRVYYSISAPGTGTDAITENSTITMNYTGRYLNGAVFDSSTDGTFSSLLSGLIQGWRKVIPGKITAGGKIRLIIPSGADTGYAADNQNGITPNACLDFDIEIISVTN